MLSKSPSIVSQVLLRKEETIYLKVIVGDIKLFTLIYPDVSMVHYISLGNRSPHGLGVKMTTIFFSWRFSRRDFGHISEVAISFLMLSRRHCKRQMSMKNSTSLPWDYHTLGNLSWLVILFWRVAIFPLLLQSRGRETNFQSFKRVFISICRVLSQMT